MKWLIFWVETKILRDKDNALSRTGFDTNESSLRRQVTAKISALYHE